MASLFIYFWSFYDTYPKVLSGRVSSILHKGEEEKDEKREEKTQKKKDYQ
jgi:hypothetical protein